MSVQVSGRQPDPASHPERSEGSHAGEHEILRSAQDETVASLLVLAAALGIALALRWPNLWLIPTFTDETREVLLAVRIYRGETAPLTNVDAYIGALWNYLLAAGFWLFGLSPWLPRLAVCLAGVATVGAAWWLGRELAGRIGGIVAAGLMATNSTHILVNSHVAWSHAITPLFTTLGFAFLARALRAQVPGPRSRVVTRRWTWDLGRGTWDLVAAGFFLGLGVQTHVTAALLLPGAALAVLLGRTRLLRTRWPAVAVAAFLLANANLVVFNSVSGGESLSGGLEHIVDYTGEETGYDTDDYPGSLHRLTLGAAWVLSGAIEKRRFVGETLADPLPLLYLIVAGMGLIWAAWRRRWLPLLVVVPYALTMPLLNPKYEPLLNGRFLTPLLPLVYAAIGLAASDGWRALRAGRGPALGWLLAGGLVALAVYPLVPLVRYEQTTERTNRAVLAAREAVLAHRQPEETVLLDSDLDDVRYMAAGSAYKGMGLLLETSDVPYAVLPARAGTLAEALAEGSPRLALLHSDKTTPLGRTLAITPVGQPVRGAGFWVYRVAPRR